MSLRSGGYRHQPGMTNESISWMEKRTFLTRIMEGQHRDSLNLTLDANGAITAEWLMSLLFPDTEVQKT